MFLPDDAVREFKEIYEAEFNEKLSDGEYRTRAENYLRLMELITKPIPNEGDKKL